MRVKAVILNWNGTKDTKECIESLLNIDLLNIELSILVIDNFSEEFDSLKDFCFVRNIDFIRLGYNSGFARANNIGILEGLVDNSDYIWILNNDLTFKRDSLKILIEFMEREPDVAVGSPKLFFYDNKSQPTGTAGKFIPLNPKLTHVDHNLNCDAYVDHFIGAAIFLRTEYVSLIGLIPEDYFMYREETDWMLNISNAGFKIAYVDSAHVYHKVSASTGHATPFQEYYMTRNTLILVKRHFKKYFYYYLIIYPIYRFISISLKYRERFKFLVRAFLNGYFDFILGGRGRNEKL